MEEAHIMSLRKLDKKGFTLIELLVVIVVIAILALLLVPNLTSAQERARDANRKNDLRVASNYLEEYYLDNGYYPTALNELVTDGYVSSDNLSTEDPQGNTYTYTPSPSGCDNSTTNCASFTLSATLENENDPDYGSSGTYSVSSLN